MAQSVGSRGVYEYITQYDSSGYNGYATIDCIVDHWWDDPAKKPTFMGTVNSLCNNPNGSAHYVVEAGKVACLIAPGLRAWHVRSNDFQRVMPGIYDINSHSIGIECNPRMTDGDIETLCQLHADLWIDYGKVPIYGHKDFMATQCPGTYYDKLDYIRARTEEIYNDILNGGTGAATEEEDDVTKEEVQAMIDARVRTYETLDDLPMGKDIVQRLINQGYLVGEGTNADGKTILNMTYDMLRIICVLDRAGAFKSA